MPVVIRWNFFVDSESGDVYFSGSSDESVGKKEVKHGIVKKTHGGVQV